MSDYCRGCGNEADGICAYHRLQFMKLRMRTRKEVGMNPVGSNYVQRYGPQENELKTEASDDWHWCNVCESNVPASHGH